MDMSCLTSLIITLIFYDYFHSQRFRLALMIFVLGCLRRLQKMASLQLMPLLEGGIVVSVVAYRAGKLVVPATA